MKEGMKAIGYGAQPAVDLQGQEPPRDTPFHTFSGLMVGLSLGLVFWGVAVFVWWVL